MRTEDERNTNKNDYYLFYFYLPSYFVAIFF